MHKNTPGIKALFEIKMLTLRLTIFAVDVSIFKEQIHFDFQEHLENAFGEYFFLEV